MAERTCTVQGCNRVHYARSWCEMHYDRWRKHGDPLTVTDRRGVQRIMPSGYAHLYEPEHPAASANGYVAVHRKVAYDAGLLVDPSNHVHHRDGDKLNNELSNLEVLTASEHRRRHAEHDEHWNSRKTQCAQGHPFDEANTYWVPNRNVRICRTCKMEEQRRRRRAAG